VQINTQATSGWAPRFGAFQTGYAGSIPVARSSSDQQLRAELGGSLAGVAQDVLQLAQHADPAAEWSPRDVIARALERVAENGAHWSRSDLTRAVSDELPGHLNIGPHPGSALLDGMTDLALADAVAHTEEPDTTQWPAELRLASGKSVFERPAAARYSTHGQFHAENALRAAAVQRAAQLTDDEADQVLSRFADAGMPLGVDQAAAVRGMLTSGARVEVLQAAAGTGKSFAVGVLAETWTQTDGRRVFGLAPSEVAAGVLGDEGLTAANTAA
jgi:hypothetical protein